MYGSSCIVPFPYAGMTQFRFEGLISVRLSPDTPNGDLRTVRPGPRSVKNAGLTRPLRVGYIRVPFGSGRPVPPN